MDIQEVVCKTYMLDINIEKNFSVNKIYKNKC